LSISLFLRDFDIDDNFVPRIDELIRIVLFLSFFICKAVGVRIGVIGDGVAVLRFLDNFSLSIPSIPSIPSILFIIAFDVRTFASSASFASFIISSSVLSCLM
jgi:hypothetical protein